MQASVAKHLSLPHEFWCFTDDIDDYPEPIVKKPLPKAGLRGWWNKIALFAPGVMPEDARVLYLDLDTVITGSLDTIATYKGDHARLAPFFRNVNAEYAGPQSGVMLWRGGSGEHIWETYVNTDYPDLPGGDQKFLNYVQPDCDLLQDLYPGRIVSYKQNEGTEPDANVALVCFHGIPRPHEVTSGWVSQFWNGAAKCGDPMPAKT